MTSSSTENFQVASPSWLVEEPVVDSRACELVLNSWTKLTSGENDVFPQSGYSTPKEFFFRSFYGRLFQVAPEARQFFRSSMESQGRALFKLVDTAISMLPPDERLVKVLIDLAQGHNLMGIALEHYYVVGGNLVHTLAKCSGSSWNDEIQNAWINLYSLMMKVMKDHIHPVPRSVTDTYNVATVTNVREVSSSMKSITLSIPFRFKYFPGQHIVMRIPAETGVTRSYTLTSTMFDTPETEFEITVKKYDHGIASNWFYNVKAGANIVIHNAEGQTYLNPNEPELIPKKLLIISGGSGITPSVAVLRCLVHFGNLDCNLTLLHSDRTLEDIYDFARLQELIDRANAKAIFTLTKTNNVPPNWTGSLGRINVEMIQTQIPNIQDQTVWLCGPAEFVNDMWDVVAHGCEVPSSQIHPIHFR